MSICQRIRVLIVAHHDMLRCGLTAFLAGFYDLEVVGAAANGEEALQQCVALHPDVTLVDVTPLETEDLAAIEAVHHRMPAVQVIALASYYEEGQVQRALRAGAISYLLKDVSADDLAAAIRAARSGRATLAPEATQELVRAATQPPLGSDLSPREREVLALMAKGLSNAAIARHIVVSHSTAKAHVSSILSKLHATSRTEAVALAMQHRLIG